MDNPHIAWEKEAEEKFRQMLEKVPAFLKETAQNKVSKRAESYARENNRQLITEKDLVDAFFKETPFGFHGPMKTDMASLGIDYVKHGHPR